MSNHRPQGLEIVDQVPASIHKPLVSIIMSFHNSRNSLRLAISSLLWQTYSCWELILLDDGSNDGSAEVLNAIFDPRIRLYGDSVCRGLPVRLNMGIAMAKGEYIARMDADDFAFPERLERQVAYLQDHPDVDLLATSVLLVGADNNSIGILPTKNSHGEICRRPWYGFPMPHPTWMGRTEWFRQNPYDESARKGQDQVLLYETYKNSNFAALPDVLLGYKYPRLSVQKTLIGRYYFLRALKRHSDTRNWLLGCIYHAIAAVRDLLSRVLGVDSIVIRRRVQIADDAIISKWKILQRRLKNISSMTES